MEMNELPEGVSRITDEHGNPALEFKSRMYLPSRLIFVELVLLVFVAGIGVLALLFDHNSTTEGVVIFMVAMSSVFLLPTLCFLLLSKSITVVSDEKIVHKAPLRRREVFWTDVTSMSCERPFLRLCTDRPSMQLDACFISPSIAEWPRYRFLVNMIHGKCDAVFDERLAKITAKKGEIAVTSPKRNWWDKIFLLVGGAFSFLGTVGFVFAVFSESEKVPNNIVRAFFAFALFVGCIFFLIRKKKRIVATESGLRISGGDMEYSWADVKCRKKAPLLSQKSGGLAQTLPISITVPGRRFAVTIPPSFVNYNLLDKFLESRGLYQRQEKRSSS